MHILRYVSPEVEELSSSSYAFRDLITELKKTFLTSHTYVYVPTAA